MVANHIHDALEQVRTLQEFLLAKRMFRGYSGLARVLGGSAALACSIVLSAPAFPRVPAAHLAGWACVLAVALAVNYGGLLVWFLSARQIRRDLIELSPAFDAIPPLAAGAALSLAMVFHGEYDLLFGIWMSAYGLAHAACRLSLPRSHTLIGGFYLLCGAACLLYPGVAFLDPWPMGIVFFFGELAAGSVLWRLRKETETQPEDLSLKESTDDGDNR